MTFRRYAALSLMGRRGLDPSAKLLSKALSLSNTLASCVHVSASVV
jgi:hypothetical protein